MSASKSASKSASGLDTRYGRIVRTPELPMAFTFGEFSRGAVIAWVTFQVLFPVCFGVTGVVSLVATSVDGSDLGPSLGMAMATMVYVGLYALPWSIGALIFLGGPLAYVLGWALRRVRHRAVHIVAFAVLGAIVGAVVCWIGTGSFLDFDSSGSGFVVIAAPATALSVAFGWWRTARRALRRESAQQELDQTET